MSFALARTDVPAGTTDVLQLSKMLAQAGEMLPDHLRAKPANIVAVMMQARALDIPMATAFSQIVVLNGRPGMQGQLMTALINRSGYSLLPVSTTATEAVVRVVREDQGIDVEVSFTIEEAAAAKLVTLTEEGEVRARSASGAPKPWELYTADMLYWRAVSRASRRYFTDVLLGVTHTPEELHATDAIEGEFSVDVDNETAEAKAFSLRIAVAADEAALRGVWEDVGQAFLTEAVVGGVKLSKRVTERLEVLRSNGSSQPVAEAPAEEGPAVPTEAQTQTAAEVDKLADAAQDTTPEDIERQIMLDAQAAEEAAAK